MKFGKEFSSQMVPEWQEAYMNYTRLKNILKEILDFRQVMGSLSRSSSLANSTPSGPLNKKASLYREFSGLTNRYNSSKGLSRRNNEDEVILVNAMHKGGDDDNEEGSGDNYRTVFLRSSEESGEYEVGFFRRLDDEFNKVVKFYKTKVGEVMKTADKLSKQMDVLIALRIKVNFPDGELRDDEGSVSGESSELISAGWQRIERAKLWEQNQSRIPGRASFSRGSTGMSLLDIIEELEKSEGHQEDINARKNKANNKDFRPASTDVLKHVKMNVEPQTPVSTLKTVLNKSEISFGKQELASVENQLKQAFRGFYHELRLLKNFCFLNTLAFSKIMKKYDKITLRNASKAYLQMVESSYLCSSDEVTRLMERVEATFIKHFCNGNRSKGMNMLRPKARLREKHRITFFLGFFFGCSIALLVGLIMIIRARNILRSDGRDRYMQNIFPLYSFFGFIVLHLLMYSANIYYWKHFRVNYSFIFGFQPHTELGYRDVLLVSSALAGMTLAGVLSNLEMEMDPRTKSFKSITELVPLGLILLILLITFCPFDIIYRANRFLFIEAVWHCICAPLYKVTLPDFFLGDQLTSQVQALRSLEFYVCYYGWGDFKKRANNCRESHVYQIFYIIIAIIPYWCRALQCLRRLCEEKDSTQALNGLKYVSTIVAVVMRTVYDLKRGMRWKIMAAAFSIIATVFSTYWDVVKDWGLLQRNSKNPWLREKLLIPHKSAYFIAMVVNVILRLAWMQTVLDIHEAPFLHNKALVSIVASLEIIRRGIWNFFRIENEHLNNVGKYRASKSVPLPFNIRG